MREREPGREIKPVKERARQGDKACERETGWDIKPVREPGRDIKPVRERDRQGDKACERERARQGDKACERESQAGR